MNNCIKYLLLILSITANGTHSICTAQTDGLRIHKECIKTANGKATFSVIDHHENLIHIRKHLLYTWYNKDMLNYTIGGYFGKLLHGEYFEMNWNGKPIEAGSYYFGLKRGCWKKWDDTGRLHSYTGYRRGLRSGQYREFDADGNLKVFCKYRNDKICGVYRIYNNSKEIYRCRYKNGKQKQQVAKYRNGNYN